MVQNRNPNYYTRPQILYKTPANKTATTIQDSNYTGPQLPDNVPNTIQGPSYYTRPQLPYKTPTTTQDFNYYTNPVSWKKCIYIYISATVPLGTRAFLLFFPQLKLVTPLTTKSCSFLRN